MPETLTFEEAKAPQTFSFEEAVAPAKPAQPEPLYGEPGGETLTEKEFTDIQAEADKAFPEPEQPGRITHASTPKEYARLILGSVLHPIRATETAVEQFAIQHGLAKEGSRLLWSPSRTMETPIKPIPQIGPQDTTMKQVGAGIANSGIELVNFFLTPEGMMSLGLGGMKKELQRLVLADWATEMAIQSPQEVRESLEAFRRGDIQEGTQKAVSGVGGTILSSVMAKHIVKPTPTLTGVANWKQGEAETGTATPEPSVDAIKSAGAPATAEALKETETAKTPVEAPAVSEKTIDRLEQEAKAPPSDKIIPSEVPKTEPTPSEAKVVRPEKIGGITPEEAARIRNQPTPLVFSSKRFEEIKAGAPLSAEETSALQSGKFSLSDEILNARPDLFSITKQLPEPTPPAEAKSNEQIEKIVTLAHEDRGEPPPIVESSELKGTDGKWYRANGFPSGVESTGERRIVGYVQQMKDGTTAGRTFKTREEAEQFQKDSQQGRDDDFRQQLKEMPPEQLKSQEDFWLSEKARKELAKQPLPPISKAKERPAQSPLGTGNAETDARLADYRRLKKAGRGMTAAQERALELYEAQVKADPSKWKVGDGIGWRVDRQINRGFRIAEIDPERKLAKVVPVADTGLTVTGGGMEGIGPEWVHVADLVRDKKYDRPEQPAPAANVEIADKERLWEATYPNGLKEQFSKESYPEKSDVEKLLAQRRQRGVDADKTAAINSEIADLKRQLVAEQKKLTKNINKMGSMVPPPIVAEVTRKIGDRMAKIQDKIDALEEQLKPVQIGTPLSAVEKLSVGDIITEHGDGTGMRLRVDAVDPNGRDTVITEIQTGGKSNPYSPSERQIRRESFTNKTRWFVHKPMELAASEAKEAASYSTASPGPDSMGITPIRPSSFGSIANLFQKPTTAVKGWLGTMAGRSMPKTTLANREAGEAGVRYASSQVAAPYLAREMSEKVLDGLNVDPDKFGAALTENQLRGRRASFQRQSADAAAAGDTDKAAKYAQMAADVKTMVGKFGLFRDEAALRAFVAEPDVIEAARRHVAEQATRLDPIYQQAIDEGSLPPKPEVGDLFADPVFANLFVPREGGVPSKRTVSVGSPKLTATFKSRTKFSMQRTGASDKYGINYHDMIANSYAGMLEIANKNVFDQALQDAGLAMIDAPGQPIEIGGQKAVSFPYKRGSTVGVLEGDVEWSKSRAKNIYVRPDLAREYEIVSNIYRNQYADTRGRYLMGLFNRLNLAGFMEALYHTRNLTRGLLSAPGRNLATDTLLSAIPGRPDILTRGFDFLNTAFRNNREKLAEIAQIGAGRAEMPVTANPLTWTSSFVNWFDRTTRVVLADTYDQLAKQGLVERSETNKREFINRVGQYNNRLQGTWMNFFRKSGIGPYITAGRTFNVQGVKSVLLSPGVEATSLQNAAYLRANLAAKVAGTMATVYIANQLITGKPTGRPGIPLGAIDTGKDDKETGKPLYIPLLDQLTLVQRGARSMGVRGAVESKREGLNNQQAFDAAARDIVNSWVHPLAGPAVQYGVAATTGKPVGVGLPRKLPVVAPGHSQFMSDMRYAAGEVNPVLAAMVPALASEPKPTLQERAGEAVKRTVQMMGPRTGMKAETAEKLPEIVNLSQLHKYTEQLATDARGKSIEARRDYILDRFEKDGLSEEYRAKALKQLKAKGVLKYE